MHAQITTRNNKAISWNPYHFFSLPQFSQAIARWGWHRGESTENMTLIPRPVWQIFQEEYSYNNGYESIPWSRKLLRSISCQGTQQTERQICIQSHGQIITCAAIARRNWIIWMWHLHSTISDFAITVWHLNNVFGNYQDVIAFPPISMVPAYARERLGWKRDSPPPKHQTQTNQPLHVAAASTRGVSNGALSPWVDAGH